MSLLPICTEHIPFSDTESSYNVAFYNIDYLIEDFTFVIFNFSSISSTARR